MSVYIPVWFCHTGRMYAKSMLIVTGRNVLHVNVKRIQRWIYLLFLLTTCLCCWIFKLLTVCRRETMLVTEESDIRHFL